MQKLLKRLRRARAEWDKYGTNYAAYDRAAKELCKAILSEVQAGRTICLDGPSLPRHPIRIRTVGARWNTDELSYSEERAAPWTPRSIHLSAATKIWSE